MVTTPASTAIHHIDDEWTVEWISGSLFDFCREHYPSMTEDDYSEEASSADAQADSATPVVRIHVRGGAGVRTIEYRRYDLVDGFDLNAVPFTTNDVIIFDLGVVHANREVRPDGVEHLRQALERHAAHRVFVLTGYQNLLPKDLGNRLPQGHVFYKPTDAVQFIGAIARAINLAG
jgi:hypothetical protein